MAERKYYCLNCECKMDCIIANLKADEEICLKRDGDDGMIVYEILDRSGFRLFCVADDGIARELCLNNNNLSYRPLFVAEDYGSAILQLKEKTKK